jgi:archaellum component FlaF (FlaF/FlaG flagellin family)
MKSQKGISVIVSYVLLITLSVAMAGLVYTVIRYKASLPEEIKCPEGTSIFIYNYSCTAQPLQLNLTIKNNGFFNVSGVNVRIFNATSVCTNSIFPFSLPLAPSDITILTIDLSNQCTSPSRISILPFRYVGNKRIYCSDAVIETNITC